MLSLLPGIQISLIVFLFLGKCQVLGDILLGQILADLNAVNVNITTMSTGPLIRAHKHGKSLIVSFKCSALFDDLVNRKRPSVWPPPKTPPTEMLPAYTMEGQVPIINWYIEEKQNGGEGYDWPVEMLADLGGKKNICGGYKLNVCATSLKKYENDFIANKTGSCMCNSLIKVSFDIYALRVGIRITVTVGRSCIVVPTSRCACHDRRIHEDHDNTTQSRHTTSHRVGSKLFGEEDSSGGLCIFLQFFRTRWAR